MISLGQLLKKQNNKIIFILVILTALFLGAMNVDAEGVNYTPISSASESTITAQKGIICEIASDECLRTVMLKEVISRNTNPGKNSYSGNNLEYVSVEPAFALVCLCVFFLLLSFWTVSYSQFFIISYIHDLDGMKL